MGDLKTITCITCPLGCMIEAVVEAPEILSISGYSCNKGKEYAYNEVTNPSRVLTTTVRVEKGSQHLVSVKTTMPVPKDMIFNFMEVILSIKTEAPVRIGNIIAANVLDTGINLVATSNVS